MTTVLHIGPPKTATTSLQETVIPRLGRPYQVKPSWVRALTRCRQFDFPEPLPPDIIVSDERLGSFTFYPPKIIADRLAQVFNNATVIYVARDPIELFYSFYRQRLLNIAAVQRKMFVKRGTWHAPFAINEFFDLSRLAYLENKGGFFYSIDINSVRIAFERYFDLTTIEFDLLKEDSRSFVSVFARACGSDLSPALSHANPTQPDGMREHLDTHSPELPAFLRGQFEDFYIYSRLSADREDFLRSFRYNRKLQAFASSFRFKR